MSTARIALNQDLKEENKQGISSILGLSGDGHSEKRLKTEFPLRRTLSADMSSKRFLAQNDDDHQSGSIKKVASSEEISISSGAPESDEDDDNRPSQFDIWSSIQSKKSALQSDNSPPYVHPLMRRSSSSLSSKSLEMCTESLGSETGSDCTSVKSHPWFSFSAPSRFFPSSSEEEDQEEEEDEDEEEEGHRSFLSHEVLSRKVPKPELHGQKSVNYNCSLSRRSPSRFFPPPLPSINRRDGPCLHVKPHRQDGRLVLEAVAVPSHNYLHAERRGGRLLLSFISTTEQKQVPPHYPLHEQEAEAAAEKAEEAEMNEGEIADHEEEEDCIEEEEGEEAEQEEVHELVRIEKKWRGNGPAVLELHRSIGKLISQPFINMNPWQQKKAVVDPAAGDNKQALVGAARVPQGLNAYECWWKGGEPGEGKVVGKVRAAAVVPSFAMNPTLVKAATGLAPSWRCNEPRRTHHIWILQHYCIATT